MTLPAANGSARVSTSSPSEGDWLEGVSAAELEEFEHRLEWVGELARPEQLTPPGDWKTWLFLAGRGAGKTRSASEDVAAYGLDNPGSRIAVVAETFADGRDVCIEGESGLLAVLPESAVAHWNRSLGELVLKNGSGYRIYSGDKPNQLRGPQHHRAWTDELAKYQYPEETWNQLQLGLRLGEDPRNVVTTTPRPIPLIKSLVDRENVVITTGSTFDNADNLAESFLEEVRRQYEGTKLGDQELFGLIVELDGDSIFSRADFKENRYDASDPAHEHASVGTYVTVDTAFKEGSENDHTAWAVWRLSSDYRLKLREVGQERLAFPDLMAKVEAVAARHNADRKLRAVVVEDRGSGTSLLQTLRGSAGWLAPYLQPFEPRGKKTERARQAAVWARQGCVLLPGPSPAAPWLHELEEEIFSFPNVEHDDRTDSFVMGILYMRHLLEQGLAFRRQIASAGGVA